jgi:hypothetical protein
MHTKTNLLKEDYYDNYLIHIRWNKNTLSCSNGLIINLTEFIYFSMRRKEEVK